jgi:hypothetical protein
MLEMTGTIAFFKQLREQLCLDIHQLESGAYQLNKVDRGEQIDASAEKLAELRHRLGNLNQVIIFYEALVPTDGWHHGKQSHRDMRPFAKQVGQRTPQSQL